MCARASFRQPRSSISRSAGRLNLKPAKLDLHSSEIMGSDNVDR
jgi:hypothetical protein